MSTSADLDRIQRRSERVATAMREFETLSLAVSHDFQIPLEAIERIARALAENDRAPDVVTGQGLREIREAAALMQAMITNLHTLVELSAQPLELAWVDMEELAREAWSEIVETKGIDFRLDRLPPARGHHGMLKLVWTNLLTNAARHSAHQEHPLVQVTGGGSGEYAIYSVRDNGAFLELDYEGKLFFVFDEIQKQWQYPGAGVGLAIVQRIVTRHRGNVWVEAHRNAGAFFQFSILTGEGGSDPLSG